MKLVMISATSAVEAANCPASWGSIGSQTRNEAELAKAARVSRNSSWRVSEVGAEGMAWAASAKVVSGCRR